MLPSIFGENLFDDFFDDFGEFDRMMNRFNRETGKALYGRKARNLMKTDVRDTGEGYELDVDLPPVQFKGKRLCGRCELKERDAAERIGDFEMAEIGLTEEERHILLENSVEAAFLSSERKALLRQRLRKSL